MRSEKTQQVLDEILGPNGYTWEYQERILLASIDLQRTHRPNLRLKGLDADGYSVDRIASFTLAIRAGDEFPAGVYALIKGKLHWLDGRHRTRAKLNAGLTHTDGYVVTGFESLDDPILRQLQRRLNVVSNSVGLTEDEYLEEALYCMESEGKTAVEVGRELPVSVEAIERRRREMAVDKIIGSADGEPALPRGLKLALYRFEKKNPEIPVRLARLFRSRPKITVEDGVDIIQKVDEAKGDVAALALITQAEIEHPAPALIGGRPTVRRSSRGAAAPGASTPFARYASVHNKKDIARMKNLRRRTPTVRDCEIYVKAMEAKITEAGAGKAWANGFLRRLRRHA